MKFNFRLTLIYILLPFLLFFYSCASVPRFTSKDNAKPKVPEVLADTDSSEVRFQDAQEVLESIVGLASYYAEPFHGRQTANGEIYDKYGLTAAHHSYPFGTIINVTNLSNNKSVNIRVNDRMPKHPARLIDLSYGTALQLDMVEEGVVKVQLDILKWGDNKYIGNNTN